MIKDEKRTVHEADALKEIVHAVAVNAAKNVEEEFLKQEDFPPVEDKYVKVPFKDVGIGSFFLYGGLLCLKTDTFQYVKADPINNYAHTYHYEEVMDPVSVVNVTYSYVRR